MTTANQLLGVPYFGASGTVEASALPTRVFKAQKNVQLQGFSGLMLVITEDEGLAAALAAQFDIRALLTYSSVCGFNFTVNFNYAAYIPYFPAGYHHGKRGNAIVFGLETPDLLAAALLRLEKQPAPVSSIFILLCALIFTRRLAQGFFHLHVRAAIKADHHKQKYQSHKKQN